MPEKRPYLQCLSEYCSPVCLVCALSSCYVVNSPLIYRYSMHELNIDYCQTIELLSSNMECIYSIRRIN